jgi:hypothetical protein
MLPSPINGGDLANGQFTKLLDNTLMGKPLGSFTLYDYAGFDPANGKMLYNTAAGTTVTQDALDAIKTKYSGSILPNSTYGITLGVNYKTLIYQLTGMELQEQKCTMVKSTTFCRRKYRESVATDFWTVTILRANPAPFNQVPVASTYYLESGDF